MVLTTPNVTAALPATTRTTSAARFPQRPGGADSSSVCVAALRIAPRLGSGTARAPPYSGIVGAPKGTSGAPGCAAPGWDPGGTETALRERARMMLCRTGACSGNRSSNTCESSSRPDRGASAQFIRSAIAASAVGYRAAGSFSSSFITKRSRSFGTSARTVRSRGT